MPRPPLAALLAASLSCCSSPPPLPAPPSEQQRAAWTRIAVVVEQAPDAIVLDGPPTTFFGRMGTGAARGGLGGAAIGGSIPGDSGIVLLPIGLVVGGVGGALLGPLLGDATDVVAARTDGVEQAIRGAALDVALRSSLERELRARGANVAAGAVVCSVRLDRVGLAGEPGFDPALAPFVSGQLVVREPSGAIVYTLPFRAELAPRPFHRWHSDPDAVRHAFADAAAQLATLLADELWCTRPIVWREGA